MKRVDPAYTHFNKRCISVTSGENKVQTIHFKDGTTAEADIVLVANGIKSSIRGMVIADAEADEEATESERAEAAVKGMSYANTAAYRGLVRRERAEALGVDTSIWRTPMVVVGKEKVCAANAPRFEPVSNGGSWT